MSKPNENISNKFSTIIKLVLGSMGIFTGLYSIIVWICLVTPSTLAKEVRAEMINVYPKLEANSLKVAVFEQDLAWIKTNIKDIGNNQINIYKNMSDIKADTKVILSKLNEK